MVTTSYLVCYDITEDDVRFGVADLCMNYGLVRIQYSVFYGLLSKSDLNSLKLDVAQRIEDSNSNVHFIKVCAACEQDHEILSSISLELKSELELSTYDEIREELPFEGGVLIL